MSDTYREYFDIDPEYFPVVDAEVIRTHPDLWKKFYPHESFMKLVKATVRVLSRQEKLSIWVEGAYGTGKSHAVLTLKKLLDAPNAEVDAYFRAYDHLKPYGDTFKQLTNLKGDGRQILTVHRYGSSNIRDDNQLVFAIQESLQKELAAKGFSVSRGAMKDAAVAWLSDDTNRRYFGDLITTQYRDLFSGETADEVLAHLKSYTGSALQTLMNQIFHVAEDKNILAFQLSVERLADWIKAVITENHLQGVVFIWDEFTEYFQNNAHALTGFQFLTEMSATVPFYFVIVTHKSEGLFTDREQGKKLRDRFVKPCTISLPETMAFRLMGKAMVKRTERQEDWEGIEKELYERTTDVRRIIMKHAGISETELRGILPLHPYGALILQHISSAFNSNQRSMFEFIKSDKGEDIHGFQWFIDHVGPEDANPFLTVDMLWDFFYSTGKEQLSLDIRTILDGYDRAASGLSSDERRVLKTVLLLQAISTRVGGNVDIFIPNGENLNRAFEGTDFGQQQATNIAEKLVRDRVLYPKPMGGGKMQYSSLTNAGNLADIEKKKVEVRKKSTEELVSEGGVQDALVLHPALAGRFALHPCAGDKVAFLARTYRGKGVTGLRARKIETICIFSKNDEEAQASKQAVQQLLADGTYSMVFINAAPTALTQDGWEQYVDNKAQAMYYLGKDGDQAKQYEQYAGDVLKRWKRAIQDGECIISYLDENGKPVEERTPVTRLDEVLRSVDRRKFPYGLETEFQVSDTLWGMFSMPTAAKFGISQTTKGAFSSSNVRMKLETNLQGAWQVERYWEKTPSLLISKIKKAVEQVIQDGFAKEGRVSIDAVYTMLARPPFGFLPCSLSAYLLGFMLKEYAGDVYGWSDGMSSAPLSVEKLADMVSDIVKFQNNPSMKHHTQYIVKMTPEEKAFNEASSKIFNIPQAKCTTVEKTSALIRTQMKTLNFPLWVLKWHPDMQNAKSDAKTVGLLINRYLGLVNEKNYSEEKTYNTIAGDIGKLCMEQPQAVSDLQRFCKPDACQDGMEAYLAQYKGGRLVALAKDIEDKGQYINAVKQKFDAQEALWLWGQDTADQKIDEVIQAYEIVKASRPYVGDCTSFSEMLKGWQTRVSALKLPYQMVKDKLGTAEPFFALLAEMVKEKWLAIDKRASFLSLLDTYGPDFRHFCENQCQLFQNVCAFQLTGLSEDEAVTLFNKLNADQFLRDKTEFVNYVTAQVEKFKSEQAFRRLQKLWREATGTNSPRAWSEEYSMPILCMADDADLMAAKEAFNAVNGTDTRAAAIQRALEFVQHSPVIGRLRDAAARDAAFRRAIIRDNGDLLTNVDEVKAYLKASLSASPYDWLGLPRVEQLVQQQAEAKYAKEGCQIALAKIERMSEREVKAYLESLIRNNSKVGMEIIKGK